jgi:hypothetical protein
MNFRASVQYDDIRGSSAADHADEINLQRALRQRDLIADEDVIAGIRIWIGENQGGQCESAMITALIVRRDEYRARIAEVPLRCRAVELEMPVVECFALFKRISIALSEDEIQEFEVEEG